MITGCWHSSRARFHRYPLYSHICYATCKFEFYFLLQFQYHSLIIVSYCVCVCCCDLIIFKIIWRQLGIINSDCEIVDVDGLLNQPNTLKSTNIDGVTIECWWGIVEAQTPQSYNWTGYKRPFKIIRDLKLKIRVNSLAACCMKLYLLQLDFLSSLTLPF